MKFKLPVKESLGYDWVMITAVFILVASGIAVIYSTTYGSADTRDLALYQGIFALMGLAAAVGLSLIDYRVFKNYFFILYIVGIIFLVSVLVLGKTVFGATRWIDIGFFRFQPSEIFKLILIVFLAKTLSDNMNELNLKKIITIIVLVLIPVGLVLIQPDLGTALVYLAILIGMLVAAGIRKIYLFGLGLAALVASPIAWLLLKGYQKQRILTFLNPAGDPFGAGYNVLQSIIAAGSGQWFGYGLGHGSQSQLNFLPIKHADFIFAVFAEELGFVGVLILLLVFVLLIIRIIRVAKIASDNFGMLIAVGIGIMLIFQILVNAGMNIGIMPVTGIPLPFVSYGGTSLVTNLAAIGLLFSIVLRRRRLSF